MTANPSGLNTRDRLITISVDASYSIERPAMHSRVWLRLRQIADSAVKRRMSTEMADLARQIRKIEYSDRV